MSLDLIETVFISIVFVLVAGTAMACETEYLGTLSHQTVDRLFEDYYGSAECTTYAERCSMLSSVKGPDALAIKFVCSEIEKYSEKK